MELLFNLFGWVILGVGWFAIAALVVIIVVEVWREINTYHHSKQDELKYKR